MAQPRTFWYNRHVMIYFAYGSNINLRHLKAFLDTHGVELDTELKAEIAQLDGYLLRTNYFAGTHGAGACNIEPAPGHHVEGVLVSITSAIRDALRVKEGFPLCVNDEIDAIVHTASTQASVRALTYMVTPTHGLDIDLPVTARYRDIVLTGARQCGLSTAYQRQLSRRLRAIPSTSNRFTFHYAS